MARNNPVIIKKYGNRRLYDTGDSRYVTLDELAAKIRRGTDVRVVDAKSNDDLTQVTLTQIIIEGRGAAKLLPVPLLTQLVRLGDDALAEFFGRYMSAALSLYLRAKQGAQAVAPYNPFASAPFANAPFAATNALARMWMNSPFLAGAPEWPGGPEPWPEVEPEWSEPAAAEPPAAGGADDEDRDAAASHADVAALRRELEELKRAVRGAGEQGGGADAGRPRGDSPPRRSGEGRRRKRGGTGRKR